MLCTACLPILFLRILKKTWINVWKLHIYLQWVTTINEFMFNSKIPSLVTCSFEKNIKIFHWTVQAMNLIQLKYCLAIRKVLDLNTTSQTLSKLYLKVIIRLKTPHDFLYYATHSGARCGLLSRSLSSIGADCSSWSLISWVLSLPFCFKLIRK